MDHFCLSTLSSLSWLKCFKRNMANRRLPPGVEGGRKTKLSHGFLAPWASEAATAAAVSSPRAARKQLPLRTLLAFAGRKAAHMGGISQSPTVPGVGAANPSLLPHVGS